MDTKFFKIWYSGLKMLGVIKNPDEKFLQTCTHTPKCTNCTMRGQCALRPMFYLDDKDFELSLQTAELIVTSAFNEKLPIDENETISFTNEIRQKRLTELKEHDDYSYER